MSQKELAEKSGVNIRQIQRYENESSNIGNMTLRNALSIASALECDVKDLLQEELMKNKITDLIEDALTYKDYNQRINFLMAALMSEDFEDTEETLEEKNNNLNDIRNWINSRMPDDKSEYLRFITEKITDFLEYEDD